MGKKISPTRIKVAQNCLRKWAFEYVYELRGDVSPNKSGALTFGTNYHAAVERYLKWGQVEASGFIDCLLTTAIPFLPPPLHPDLRVEYEVEHDGISGTLDLFFQNVLYDHKTTGSIEWIPSAKKLSKDLQSNFYALACMNEFGLDELECRWLYVVKDEENPECIPVEFIVTREGAESVWKEATTTKNKMLQLIDNVPAAALTVEKTEKKSYCQQFGGCPYYTRCHQDRTVPYSAVMQKFVVPETGEDDESSRVEEEVTTIHPAIQRRLRGT